MDLGNFSHSDIDRNETQGIDRGVVYDQAQEILDVCNRDLEELRMKVLKTSVRCHMLEVDLATQFNPRNQQVLADAQESCRQCSEAIPGVPSFAAKPTPMLQEMSSKDTIQMAATEKEQSEELKRIPTSPAKENQAAGTIESAF